VTLSRQPEHLALLDRLAFDEWFAANRESLISELSETQDEAELTVLAMKAYRQLLKVSYCYTLPQI